MLCIPIPSLTASYETWEEVVSDNLQNKDYSCLDVYVYIYVAHNMCNIIHTLIL